MSRPTARVLALLEILQSGGTHTAPRLAERLDVDERTVRRYIDHLLDLDIPVRTERGRYGGYHLAPGFRMPPLMLTDDEAVAVLLGLVVGRRSGLISTSADAADAAASKLRRVLPTALGQRLDALVSTLDFTEPLAPQSPPAAAVLLVLAEAARDRRPVAISYTGGDGRPTQRIVHPYGTVVHSGRWYVIGADSLSDEVRNFRVDRIDSAELSAGRFEVPDGFDPATRVVAGLAETPYRHAVSVRVQGTVEQVRPLIPGALATIHEVDSESPSTGGAESVEPWVRVLMRAERLEWIPALLASLGRPFVIEEPDALRDEVRVLARRLADGADVIADRPLDGADVVAG